MRACQGRELLSLLGTAPGCWWPLQAGTVNGNARSVSGSLRPGAEPSAPNDGRSGMAVGVTCLPTHCPSPDTSACCTGPPSDAAGADDRQLRSGPWGGRAHRPAGWPCCLRSPTPSGSRLCPPCRGRHRCAWSGCRVGPASAECLHPRSWGPAGPAARCHPGALLDGRRGGPRTASVPQVRPLPLPGSRPAVSLGASGEGVQGQLPRPSAVFQGPSGGPGFPQSWGLWVCPVL